MTEKQKMISAFKDLDFQLLDILLDDNKSYMDVSKSTFLSALRRKVEQCEDLKQYDYVEEGICNNCNKGSKAYKFKKHGKPSLNLFFEEKNGVVNDIYLCHDLKTCQPDEDVYSIYFSFYEEEKLEFKPSIEYLIKLQRIDRAIEDFKKLREVGLIPLEDVLNWFYRMKELALDLELNDPFQRKSYKAFQEIDRLYSKVYHLQHNFDKNQTAKDALITYNEIVQNDEKSIVRWLLNNENNHFYSLKKTDNWKKTGILILDTEPILVVDCSDCLESFIFDEIYYKHWDEIMSMYEPTKEHFEENGGSITCDLKTYLKLHNKYLDLF